MASNITKEYSESLCADIQSLFLMTVKLPAVTPEIAHQMLALWLYLEKEIPQTVSTILLSDKKEKNLWGICCPFWSTADYSLEELILEAQAAVAHLLQAEDSHLPPSAVDLMLLKTREVISNNQASKSVPFLKNELVKSEFYQNLRTCAGLCPELVPKAHQLGNSHQGTIDFVEDRSLTIEVTHPIVQTDLQMAITRRYGPCIESLTVDPDHPNLANLVLLQRQDATTIMGGTVRDAVIVDVEGHPMLFSRVRSDLLK